jgi:hypothetical protein
MKFEEFNDVAVAALPLIDPDDVMNPLGFVELYGVNPKAVVTLALVNVKAPPRVRLPVDVTDPLRVKPLTVPVPPTDVTVPVFVV